MEQRIGKIHATAKLSSYNISHPNKASQGSRLKINLITFLQVDDHVVKSNAHQTK
jgi:hypothetical protein